MNPDKIKALLLEVQKNKISVNSAIHKLKKLPFKDLEFAKVDTHRNLRRGFPEVIYCEGKKDHQVIKIFNELKKANENVIATRAEAKLYRKIKKKFPKTKYNEEAKVITLIQKRIVQKGLVAVVTGGTTDSFVAEEARITAELLGAKTKKIYDVGIAGIHRIFAFTDWLYKANVIIVVAGMEGALPSIVAGIVDKPVIAVPTSIGYGTSFSGVAPLLSMLNSCVSGITVVNIDNGFGAGCAAGLINRLVVKKS